MKALQIFFGVLLLLAGLVSSAPGADLAKVSFIPQWVPQSQFAGYYVAHDRGIYRQHHLDVRILRGGPDRPPSDLLEKGQADFGTMFLASTIIRRSQGAGLINVGQIVQKSALMLVARKASGINKPEDINGKKVGLWGREFQAGPRAFFRKYHLTVEEIPQSANLNLFLRGGVEVASAMWYNEYHLLLNAGLDPKELTTFLLSDYGMNFPEDGIYCREEMVRQQPEVCREFAQASLEGWQYALAHPEEALDIVMKYVKEANVPTDRVHQKWMLERLRDLIVPAGSNTAMGSLDERDYNQVAQELQKGGLIGRIPAWADFYVNFGAGGEK